MKDNLSNKVESFINFIYFIYFSTGILIYLNVLVQKNIKPTILAEHIYIIVTGIIYSFLWLPMKIAQIIR